MRELAVFAVAGIGTYAARSVFILAVGTRSLPEWAEQALRNVGPAVLAALTASLLVDDGVTEFLTDAPEVVAIAVALFVAWRWRNFLVTFGTGLATLWLLQALV